MILRIMSLSDACKETADIMKELRLTNDYSVVFCRRTPELMRKLILVEPYVAWGHPNLTTIQELLSKRAFTIVYTTPILIIRLIINVSLYRIILWWKIIWEVRMSFV